MSGPNEHQTAIEVNGLTKVYAGGVEAVKGLTFTVRRGEVFGLLGPNGAGKSTTIGMLTTTVSPTSGSAMVAGCDIVSDPIGARAASAVVSKMQWSIAFSAADATSRITLVCGAFRREPSLDGLPT